MNRLSSYISTGVFCHTLLSFILKIWENITYHKNCSLQLHFPLISINQSAKDYSGVERNKNKFQANERFFLAK